MRYEKNQCLLQLTLTYLLCVRPVTGKQSSSVIMLSCLLRKGLNLPKQKSLKAEVSLYPQNKYHLQAGPPPFLLVDPWWDRFSPSRASQGVQQTVCL